MPVSLTPRLQRALEWLKSYEHPCDIGCDHGKLSAALLQQGCERVIACDISEPSLQKARELGEWLSLKGLITRLGSGFAPIEQGECDCAALMGMGGELIAALLEEGADIAKSLRALVLQPMGGEEELRRFLYEQGYSIKEDVLIKEGRRYYQLLHVQYRGQQDPWPEGFPEDFFLLGYQSYAQGEPLLGEYCRHRIAQRDKRLKNAAGTGGAEKLLKERTAFGKILDGIEGESL